MSKRTNQSPTHVNVEQAAPATSHETVRKQLLRLAQTLGRIAAREDDARERDRVLKGNGT